MQSDLNLSTSKKTASGKDQQHISQGQCYTLLSCTKYCSKVLLLSFDPEDVKVN